MGLRGPPLEMALNQPSVIWWAGGVIATFSRATLAVDGVAGARVGVGVAVGAVVAAGALGAAGAVVAVGAGVAVAPAPQATAKARANNKGLNTITLGFLIQCCTMIAPPDSQVAINVRGPPAPITGQSKDT